MMPLSPAVRLHFSMRRAPAGRRGGCCAVATRKYWSCRMQISSYNSFHSGRPNPLRPPVPSSAPSLPAFSKNNFADGEPSWCQISLEDELADVSSWLFALVEKLDTVRQTANEYDRWRFRTTDDFRKKRITLSQIIWQRYGSDDLKSFLCPHCHTTAGTCECRIILVPADRSVQDVLNKVDDVLRS